MSHDVMQEVEHAGDHSGLIVAQDDPLPCDAALPAATASDSTQTNGTPPPTITEPTAEPTPAPPRPAGKAAFGSSPTALQDMFLNGLRRENIDVVIYFCDGSQERGAIRAFDTFTILLENRNSGKAQLLYKHAIARIFPTRTPTQLFPSDRAGKK